MKVRLVQDSHTKHYRLEYWVESTSFPLGKPPVIYGRWELRNNPNYDPSVKNLFDNRDEAQHALSEWVGELMSKTIVIEEVDTNSL